MSIKLCAKMLLSGILLSCFASCPAFCRSWKPAPDAMARDYATITDARGKGEMVLLMWFAPQMVSPSAPGAPALTAMLEKYIVLVATHAHVNPTTAAMTFVPVDQLEAHDGAGSALVPVARETLPPVTTGVLAAIETMFRQSFGAMGQGMKTFVFDAGAVHSCEKGGWAAVYAGETYTWETPIPGCPQNTPTRP